MQYHPTKSQRCFNGGENTFYQIEIWLDQNTLHCCRYFNLRSTSEYRVNINVTLLSIFQSLFNVEMPAEYQRHIAVDISIYVQRRHIELISTYIAADISISVQRRNVAIISRSHCCRYFNIRSTLGCVGGLPNINVALLTRFKLSFYVSYWWISGPGVIHYNHVQIAEMTIIGALVSIGEWVIDFKLLGGISNNPQIYIVSVLKYHVHFHLPVWSAHW